MARYFQVDKRDIHELLNVIPYICGRKGEIIDAPMVDLLMEMHQRISEHVFNENEFKPDGTITEIDLLQNMIGNIDGRTDDSGDPGGD